MNGADFAAARAEHAGLLGSNCFRRTSDGPDASIKSHPFFRPHGTGHLHVRLEMPIAPPREIHARQTGRFDLSAICRCDSFAQIRRTW